MSLMIMNPVARAINGSTSAPTFDINSIFANGEQGVWLEPWDLTTMFQDAAGTIPVTSYGQAVGLRLDKSKGLVLGPELITNGGFDTDTNWAKNAGITVSGGELVFTSVASANGASQDSSGIVAGRLYKVKLNVTSITAGGFMVKVGNGSYVTVSAGTGLKEFYCIAGATTTKVISIDASGTTSGTIDDVSVKELYGNHAYQTTATSRAIYGRLPKTGKNNLLKNSLLAGGGAVPTDWLRPTATGSSTPNGTINGNTIYRHTATAQRPYFQSNAGFTLGTSGTINFSVFIEAVHSGAAVLQDILGQASLPTGATFGSFAVDGVPAISITPITAGTRVSAVITSGGTAGTPVIRVGLGCAGNVTADVSFSRPMVNVGSTALNYQNSVSDYDTTEDGVQTLYGLKYDGVDDYYITPSIDFTGTDKMSVWAGVRKLSDAARAILVELSSSVANAGSFNIEAPNNNNFPRFAFSLNGSATAVYQSDANQAAPANKVIQASFNIAGSTITDEIKHRINGASTAGSATIVGPAGTGNFGNYPLYIGSRAGTSLRYNGWEFGIIARGAASNDTQIAAVDDYLNQHTGAY
jgi:hypothetical protein